MIDRNTFARYSLAMLCIVGTVSLVGCSDDGLARRYPVSGKVTYNGQPLAKGEITFMPDKPDGRGGSGLITNGEFTLTTQNPGDGGFPGSYSVIVTSLNVDLGAAEAASKKSADSAKVEANMPDQAAVGKALQAAKNSIPDKYGRVRESGLKATVEEKSNFFTFELKD